MTRRAAFAKRQVLVSKGASLLLVAFKALLVDVIHRRGGPGPCVGAMRIMAIGAGHMTFQHRMMMREPELGLLFHVAGKTHFRVLPRINDLVPLAAAGFRMETAWTVAHLAAFDFDAFHRNGDPLMRS